MSTEGLQTCPHCRAIVQSTICAICGKSAFETVAAPTPQAARRWTDSLEHHELRNLGIGAFVVVALLATVGFVLTREAAAPPANSLPPPASTTTVAPKPTTSEAAPSVVGGARPASGFTPGAPREVGEGRSPWETPPPVDVVTGLLLDERLDFSADIARVDELLGHFPEPFTLAALEPPALQTLDGVLDVDQIETTQPLALRTVTAPDGATIGELWLLASGGSEAGDLYLARGRERWNRDAAVDEFAPEVGLRLWLLGSDEATKLWVGDVDPDALLLMRVPGETDPVVLGDLLRDWRRNFLRNASAS